MATIPPISSNFLFPLVFAFGKSFALSMVDAEDIYKMKYTIRNLVIPVDHFMDQDVAETTYIDTEMMLEWFGVKKPVSMAREFDLKDITDMNNEDQAMLIDAFIHVHLNQKITDEARSHLMKSAATFSMTLTPKRKRKLSTDLEFTCKESYKVGGKGVLTTPIKP